MLLKHLCEKRTVCFVVKRDSVDSQSESESEKALLPSTILHIRGICCGDVGARIK